MLTVPVGASVTLSVDALPTTFTAMPGEVTVALLVSVERAVIVKTPAAVGVQLNEYDGPVELPTTVPFARKSTFVITTPVAGETEALSCVAEPTLKEAP
jgi:hypothetical protein